MRRRLSRCHLVSAFALLCCATAARAQSGVPSTPDGRVFVGLAASVTTTQVDQRVSPLTSEATSTWCLEAGARIRSWLSAGVEGWPLRTVSAPATGELWNGWRSERETTLAGVVRFRLAQRGRLRAYALGGMAITRVFRRTTYAGVNPMTHGPYQTDSDNWETVPGVVIGGDAAVSVGHSFSIVPRMRVLAMTRQVMGVFSPPRNWSVQLFIGAGLRWER